MHYVDAALNIFKIYFLIGLPFSVLIYLLLIYLFCKNYKTNKKKRDLSYFFQQLLAIFVIPGIWPLLVFGFIYAFFETLGNARHAYYRDGKYFGKRYSEVKQVFMVIKKNEHNIIYAPYEGVHDLLSLDDWGIIATNKSGSQTDLSFFLPVEDDDLFLVFSIGPGPDRRYELVGKIQHDTLEYYDICHVEKIFKNNKSNTAPIWFKKNKQLKENVIQCLDNISQIMKDKYVYEKCYTEKYDDIDFDAELRMKVYYENSQIHRTDGPAIIFSDKTKFWFEKNELKKPPILYLIKSAFHELIQR